MQHLLLLYFVCWYSYALAFGPFLKLTVYNS
jgi:hypothetical protein